MNAEGWEEIKQCFEAALKLDRTERSIFVQSACNGKPGMARMVEDLLKARDEAPDFLASVNPLIELAPVFKQGQLISDRFRIIRLISRGGMGEVYEAFDERLSVSLALKTLRPEYASDRDAIERFRREIRVTRHFGHPNLCRVYELVEHRLPPDRVITCLTMQLMSGETLQQYLLKSRPLSPQVVLPLIQQIVSAVEVLHRNGIIHRDLKPSNIMITPSESDRMRAIVMDFGLAKPFDTDPESFESRSDFQAGAPFYLAPEVLRGDRPSIASDVYALGMIIDEMVTCRNAFVGHTLEEVLYQKLWHGPNDPKERAPDLPTQWCETIRRCLDPDPGKRFADVTELITSLRPESAQTVTRPLVRFRPLPPRTPRRSLGLRWKSVALTFLFSSTAIGLALGFVVDRPRNTSAIIYDIENWTGNPAFDYICKDITFETKRILQAVPGIDVKQYYRPHPTDASFKPDAQFSLEGHLQTIRTGLRFSADVFDNRTRKIIWITAFDEAPGKTLEMETEFASGAVDAMRGAIFLPKQQEDGSQLFRSVRKILFLKPALGAVPTTNSAAWEAYLRGHALLEERTLDANRKAVLQFEEALREDPGLAFAYSDLSALQLRLLEYNFAPRDQLLAAADRFAQQAIATGPNFPESHTALAAVRQLHWDGRGAEESYKRAIQLGPRNARAHRWYGGFLIQFGRFDEGLREMRRSITLDPYDYSARLTLGTYLQYAGRPQEAISFLESSLAEKDYAFGHETLGFAYAQLSLTADPVQRIKLLDKALVEADTVAKDDHSSLGPDAGGLSAPMYAIFHALRGDTAAARLGLKLMLEAAPKGAVTVEDLATTYVALGDKAKALNLLRQAVQQRDSGLLYIKVNRFLDPLKDTPEWKDLIARTGL